MGKMLDSLNVFRRYVTLDQTVDSFSNSVFNGWDSYNLQGLKKEYRNLVHTCMNIRATEAAKYQPTLFTINPRISVSDQLEDHEFLQLLESPSPYMSQKQLFLNTCLDLDNYGKAYWYVPLTAQGKPAAPGSEGWGIQIVEPWRVERQYDKNTGELLGYKVQRHNGTYAYLEINECWEFCAPRELGIIAANFLYIDTENETSNFQNAFMHNSATPSGVATVKGSITKEAFDKLKRMWRDQQQGARNAGKTLFIRNGDFEFVKTGLSIAELDMGTLKQITKDEVRTAFRIPKPKLGDTDGQGLGRGNVETVDYMFAKDVVDNIQGDWDDTLQRYARACYGEGLFIDHVSQIPQNEEFLLQQDQALTDIIYTRNEVRKRRGEEPVEGGDVLRVSFNTSPIDSDVEEPLTVTNTKTVTTQKMLPKVEKKTPQAQYFDRIDRIEQATDSKYRKTFVSLVNQQKREALSILNANKALSDDLEENATEEAAAILWAKKLIKILFPGMEDAGTVAVNYVGPTSEFVLEQATRDAVFNSTKRLIADFGRETALKLQKQISLGLDAGETIEQLTARVESVYEEAAGYRAHRIAQTEAHRAINEGVREGYSQSGVQYMQWVTDGNACEFCAAMEGTISEIDQPFLSIGDEVTGESGKSFTVDYTDVEAADLHPNCNCKLVPLNDFERSMTPKMLVKVREDTNIVKDLQEALEDSEAFNRKLLETFGVDDG